MFQLKTVHILKTEKVDYSIVEKSFVRIFLKLVYLI